MIPTRYLIATLFIAALLLLLAIVQGNKNPTAGGVRASQLSEIQLVPGAMEHLAEFRLEEGWAPRYVGAQDPDQDQPWPPEGAFGFPWEPPSPYLDGQGLALNGPNQRSQVVIWRGLEWRRYRFDSPLASARLAPGRHDRLLLTFQIGERRYETRLLELPEGRVIWRVDSGPWSRFSWDGQSILLGLYEPALEQEVCQRLLLTRLPVDSKPEGRSLSDYSDSWALPFRKWPTLNEHLSADGQDLPGDRLLVPWWRDSRLWMPFQDRLWIRGKGNWELWSLEDHRWSRIQRGEGLLIAQPPIGMGLWLKGPSLIAPRKIRRLEESEWTSLPESLSPWPEYDPAWVWSAEGWALTTWGLEWPSGVTTIPREKVRQDLQRSYRGEWLASKRLRASVEGWLPKGPEIALRETLGIAWVWHGHGVVLLSLPDSQRYRFLRKHFKK